jgi:ketosteroid isomerase-like protein
MMDEKSLRDKTEQAFLAWQKGTGNITTLFADNLVWTIKGHSLASKTYHSKKEFIDELLRPFAARFSERFRPVSSHVYVDGDTAIVLWEGEGTRVDAKPYKNSYAFFLRYQDGLVVEGTAFFDSLAFNQLWTEVTPKE